MHEVGLTARIVDAVCRAAGGQRVVRVDLVIGRLTFISVRQVRLAFDLLSPRAGLPGVELDIRRPEGRVRCSDCGLETAVEVDEELPVALPGLRSCSVCGGPVTIVGGREFELSGIVVCQ